MREKLFSILKQAFEVQHMRAGGSGGQKQNKTSSATRIVHKESGAVGEARDERQQSQNTKNAFRRLVDSPKFKAWLRLKIAMVFEGFHTIEKKLDAALAPQNLKVEVKHTVTCDGCGKAEQSDWLPDTCWSEFGVPSGWMIIPDSSGDRHYCQKCRESQ